MIRNQRKQLFTTIFLLIIIAACVGAGWCLRHMRANAHGGTEHGVLAGKLTEELVDKLVPDVQKGMTLSAAYRKLEKAQEAEKIAELERKLAAKQQNANNRRSSPGSQHDSGGSRSKDMFDEFMAAFA